MSITVLLVDDNGLFRDGIAQILRADGRFDVVGQASSGEDAVVVARRLRPDLILMDLQMPGMGGIDAIRAIRADNAAIPIGVLTMFETREHVEAAEKAGATGYIAKDSTPADFREAAAALAKGAHDIIAIPQVPPSDPRPGPGSGALARLTVRELTVLRALATAAGNEAIARSLQISPKTLRNHISRIYQKLGIYDRAQAVIVAVREGLVDIQRR
jgi:DNA-binding NarL/FixJ family response regulator